MLKNKFIIIIILKKGGEQNIFNFTVILEF